VNPPVFSSTKSEIVDFIQLPQDLQRDMKVMDLKVPDAAALVKQLRPEMELTPEQVNRIDGGYSRRDHLRGRESHVPVPSREL